MKLIKKENIYILSPKREAWEWAGQLPVLGGRWYPQLKAWGFVDRARGKLFLEWRENHLARYGS